MRCWRASQPVSMRQTPGGRLPMDRAARPPGSLDGDRVGRGTIVAVGAQHPLSKDLCFQHPAGLGGPAATQAESSRAVAGDGDLQTG
jgi:hypothetical protein